MTTMTTEQIADILRKHKLWLESEPGGTRAVLTGADLTRAVLTRAVLTGANLTGADLTRAVLTRAVLTGANLTGANLTGANLTGVDLTRAVLTGANLRSAVLTGANLTGVDLTGAVLRSAVLRSADIPVIPDLDRRILAAIEVGGTLEMDAWHTCDTTHCRAGWATVVAGEAGAALERAVGTPAAAALMYAAIRPHERVPDFYASNEDALADISRCAALPLESQS